MVSVCASLDMCCQVRGQPASPLSLLLYYACFVSVCQCVVWAAGSVCVCVSVCVSCCFPSVHTTHIHMCTRMYMYMHAQTHSHTHPHRPHAM